MTAVVGTGHRTHTDPPRGTFPISRAFEELFSGQWLLLKAVHHVPKTQLQWTSPLARGDGREREHPGPELTPGLTPALIWNTGRGSPFYPAAVSLKHDATNHPDFRLNINL